MGFLSKIVDGNKKEIKRLGKLADKVLALEEDTAILTDEEIREKTKSFQKELAEIEDVKKQNDYLDKILPEAYALVREGSKRVFNMIPYKVQVMGGIAIHGGLIGGFITGIIVCKMKNLNPFQIGDIVAPSIILAQGIGRWGNFMNHEAHGGIVSKSFLEQLHLPQFIIDNMYIDGHYYHPTFLYESVWDVLGFIILVTVRKHLKLGETFFLYLIWYSIGRFFVEGLRTDSLMLTSHIRVAQLVSIILIIVSIMLIIYRRVKFHPSTFKNSGPLQWPGKKA